MDEDVIQNSGESGEESPAPTRRKSAAEMLPEISTIELHMETRRGDPYTATFKLPDAETMSQFDSLSFNVRKRRPEQMKAIEYLFQRKFISTDIEWESFLSELGYKDEKEFFLKDNAHEGRLNMRAMIDAYIGDRPQQSFLNE